MPASRRSSLWRTAVVVALLAGACSDDGAGDDDGSSFPAPETPATETPVTEQPADPRLPFDLGPGIIPGGDDVVGDGFEVTDSRFVDEIEDRPTETEATVYRWTPSGDREAAVQAAVTDLVGDPDVEIVVDGPRFEFETGDAHGHGGEEPEPSTTAPTEPSGSGLEVDEDEVRVRTLAFLRAAGFDPVAESVTTFEGGGFVSIESSVRLAGQTPVLRATASVTYDTHGDVVGGYGPVGEAVPDRTVEVVDVDTALARLALTEARAGHPTTTAVPTEPVTIVAADLVLSLREVVDADGVPTGESWLLPVYRFVDDAGIEREVNAVVADELRLD